MNREVMNFIVGRKQVLILFLIVIGSVSVISFTSLDEKLSFSSIQKNNSANIEYSCNYVWPQQIINKNTSEIIKICPMSNPYCKAGTTQCCNYNFTSESHYNCIDALTNQLQVNPNESQGNGSDGGGSGGADGGNSNENELEENPFDTCDEGCESIGLDFGFNADSSADCFAPDTYHEFGNLKCCCSLPDEHPQDTGGDRDDYCDEECKLFGWDGGFDSPSSAECEISIIPMGAEDGVYTHDNCCCYIEEGTEWSLAEQECYDLGFSSGRGPVATPEECNDDETVKQINNQFYCCGDYIGTSQAGCEEVIARTGNDGTMYNPAWNVPTNDCRDWGISFCQGIGQSISIWVMQGDCCLVDCYTPEPPEEPEIEYICNYTWPQQILNKDTNEILWICPMSPYHPYCKAGTTQCCRWTEALGHYDCVDMVGI